MKKSPRRGATNAPRAPFDSLSRRSKSSDSPRSGDASSGDFWRGAAAFFALLGRGFFFVGRRVGPFLVASLRQAPALFAGLALWGKRAWIASRSARRQFVADAPRLGRSVWDGILAALAPSATWPSTRTPDFLLWGIVEFFLWRLPFSIVGILYAILANESRRSGDLESARARAARAKNWLLADLALGLLVAPLRFFL